jgi:hypothetical protein
MYKGLEGKLQQKCNVKMDLKKTVKDTMNRVHPATDID